MCLAIPARVVTVSQNDRAVVDVGGNTREISVAFVPDIVVGDYVLVHVGYALQRLDIQEAEKTLALFRELQALDVPEK